ncbi:MAG: hypothetical protein HZB86_06890 [Deltaproteobacteria bacterium]|nr:hypothetical protein [Deltaproteobacteria bacterium]
MAKEYRVYKVDYLTKMRIPIGTVKERRVKARPESNHLGLMKLARRMYGATMEEQLKIILGEELVA